MNIRTKSQGFQATITIDDLCYYTTVHTSSTSTCQHWGHL